jgi:hypothetical protein
MRKTWKKHEETLKTHKKAFSENSEKA